MIVLFSRPLLSSSHRSEAQRRDPYIAFLMALVMSALCLLPLACKRDEGTVTWSLETRSPNGKLSRNSQF